MWTKLREIVAGMAEQAGIEVPGLDTSGSAFTDLAGSAGDAASGVLAEVAASDVVGSATNLADLAGSVSPGELVTGATDAAASAGEGAAGVAGDASTTMGGLLEPLKGGLAP